MRKWFVNVAISFDGRISNPDEQVELSDENDWKIVHKMRNRIAAIVVGANTVITDNPTLKTKTKYIEGEVNHPIRVVLDQAGRCLPEHRVFCDQDIAKTIWVTNSTNDYGVMKLARFELPEVVKHINAMLDEMGREGDVMIEGGATVINNFINDNLVNEMRIFRAPILLPNGIPLFPRKLRKKITLSSVKSLGYGIEEHYLIQ
ncbi:MAG: RibD family protein [Candidatus Heimdallarchaeota archaeon]|nr:RibD family protein [Candidatus Heimdallarchaeota archaeon]